MRPAAAAGGMESATRRCDSIVVALSSPLKKTQRARIPYCAAHETAYRHLRSYYVDDASTGEFNVGSLRLRPPALTPAVLADPVGTAQPPTVIR